MFTIHISPFEIIIRVVLIYFFLLILVRISGKREIGELSPMDFLAMLILAETVSPALTADDTSLTAAGIAAFTLLGMSVLISYLSYRFPRFERVIEGKPLLLIRNGRINEKVMKRERITEEDLKEALHQQEIESVEEVAKAYVERSGKITVIKSSK